MHDPSNRYSAVTEHLQEALVLARRLDEPVLAYLIECSLNEICDGRFSAKAFDGELSSRH